MPAQDQDEADPVADAAWLAREVATDLQSVLVTLYPDAETLDTLRTGEVDLETANAIARAVAEVMAEEGVEVFVQRADRSAFRRWLATRADTPEQRRSWVDRERLLRGVDAWRALRLKAPPAAPPPAFPPAPGPVAEHLLAAHADLESDDFEALVNDLLDADRGDVLDLALRKMADGHSEQNAAELRAEMLGIAGGAALGASGWAELVALPVALTTGTTPDAIATAEGLLASEGLEPEEALRFLPGWRSPEAIEALSPPAMRGVLIDLIAGREPRDLPPGDTDDLVRRGFGVLVGLRTDWSIPVWDVISAAGGLPEDGSQEDETPEATERARAIDRWRARFAAETEGSVPLDLVPLAEVGDIIADFLDEAGAQVEGIDQIRDFIAEAVRQAEGVEVVCRPEIIEHNLELAAYTASGRFLGSLTLPPSQLPAPATSMLGLIGGWVRLVKDVPGR